VFIENNRHGSGSVMSEIPKKYSGKLAFYLEKQTRLSARTFSCRRAAANVSDLGYFEQQNGSDFSAF